LFLERASGLSETDERKIQRWALEPDAVGLQGVPTLTLRAAAKDFETESSGVVLAALYDCDLTHADCFKVSSSAASIDFSGGGTDFGVATVVFDPIDHTFATDRMLVLKVIGNVSAGDGVWLAYGTDEYDSVLSIE
jgi:hypothetical protein